MESSAVLWLKLAGSEGFMDIAGAGGALARMLYSYLYLFRLLEDVGVRDRR